MLIRLLVLVVFFLSISETGVAQRRYNQVRIGGFSTVRGHKPTTQLIVGLGASGFLGDLGGADRVGSNYLRDLDFKATRPAFNVTLRRKFDKYWALRGGFYYLRVSGDDALTKNTARNDRNLSFRSDILELSAQVEFFFLNKEEFHKRYKSKRAKGLNNIQLNAYVFAGVGLFYFNPKAKYDGNWVALQPLGTEGQGLEGQPNRYSRVSIAIPIGIGFKQPVSEKWSVGVEFTGRKTFTDYIDDVSTNYYSRSELAAQSATAAALSDPRKPSAPPVVPGDQRGDPFELDSYLFVNLTATYTISRSSTQAKKRSKGLF